MLFYFTNLIIWNNIYKKVSKQSHAGLHYETKSPGHFPFTWFLLAYTIK